MTNLDTTITGSSHLGDTRSPFVPRPSYGRATLFFKKTVPIKTLHEAHLHGLQSLACLVVPTELKAEGSGEEAERDKQRKGIATGKIETPLPVFTRRSIVLWAKHLAGFLRLTGQTQAPDMIEANFVVTGCKTDWLRELLEDLVTKFSTSVEYLAKIEETFPVLEVICTLPNNL